MDVELETERPNAALSLGAFVSFCVFTFETALAIICMILASPALVGVTSFFLFVVSTAFIATILWTFIYLFSIREALKLPINWILSELINTGIFTIAYAIAFIAQLSLWGGVIGANGKGANIAAGVFGIINCIAYGVGTYFLYIEWQSSNTQ
ncbi:CKLF-like MARVEL transmembrane domain-containing protein 4 [Neodiprion fabricii]|uniref:CKLF-like MARVEL transmembrane domain-containing protein 4 n=1 Tax=Neodiprion fabricii TaxID=2872261 RepID=UPI001ED9525A|nr:CKLF-like MARVEL transmembrane domain-containing protein 4 [Neodiprion fabricii]